MKPQPQDAREKAWRLWWFGPKFSSANQDWELGQTKQAFNAGYAARRDGWVRIEDGLPTEDGYYLVTATRGFTDESRDKNRVVGIYRFKGSFFEYEDDPGQHLLAWAPLPQPYTVGDEKQ